MISKCCSLSSLSKGADVDGDGRIKNGCFQTPDLKITPADFVIRSRNRSMLSDSSLIPEIAETVFLIEDTVAALVFFPHSGKILGGCVASISRYGGSAAEPSIMVINLT